MKSAKPRQAPANKTVRAANGGTPSDAVERRAYEIYQLHGAQHGFDLDHWLQAERELNPAKPKRAKKAPAAQA